MRKRVIQIAARALLCVLPRYRLDDYKDHTGHYVWVLTRTWVRRREVARRAWHCDKDWSGLEGRAWLRKHVPWLQRRLLWSICDLSNHWIPCYFHYGLPK